MKGGLTTYERVEICGLMPERALLRLRRAGISLYDVQKTQKDALRLCVKPKDRAKIAAIYSSAWHNGNTATYTIRYLGKKGLGKYVDWAVKRIGFTIGACLFSIATLAVDSWVFGIDFTASSVYQRETCAALEEYGIKPFSRYKKGNEDLICSKLLTLDGVEFCSVKKSGFRVVVDMRVSNASSPIYQTGDMQAKHEGTLLSLTALKGSPQKQVGDSVRFGETLVGAWIEVEEGNTRKTDVIARASIACVYECVVDATDTQEAFAIAYMQAGITAEDKLTDTQTTAMHNGYHVKIAYTAIESINF